MHFLDFFLDTNWIIRGYKNVKIKHQIKLFMITMYCLFECTFNFKIIFLLPEQFCREHENVIPLDGEGCQHVPLVSTPSRDTRSSENAESWSKRFFGFEQN